MATFRDLLRDTKARIREVDTATAAAEMGEPGAVVLDVREPDEYEQGALPGAIHIPRGHLESQVEGRVTDHDAHLVVYCAGGTRSAFAADTLGQLGYTDVVSVVGGFNKWKDEGRPWQAPVSLTPDQRNRYQRHLLLPEVDVAGQAKLLESKVLLLGAGGLGSPAAMYLAAAGVGTLGIIDMDVVDESNLQRQILHNLDRVGERKVDSAKKTLTALNPDVNVVTYDVRLGADNVLDIFAGYDVIVDGTDNFPTRYLVNDASLKLDIPVVHGSIFRFEGQASVYLPHQGPCYRCQVPEPPPRRAGPFLRRGRRARRAARHHRQHPGHGGHQAAARDRRASGRPAPGLRRPGGELPDLQGQPRPRVRGVQHPQGTARHRRIRRALHAAPDRRPRNKVRPGVAAPPMARASAAGAGQRRYRQP